MRKIIMPEIDINDPKVIEGLYKRYYPRGSGELGAMRLITGLLWAIAKEKGIELENPPVIKEGDILL